MFKESKVLIDTYRGWEISFDKEKGEFYCFSDMHDNDSYSKSFASVKKYIDEYIKENTTFKPFYVEGIRWHNAKSIKIVGLRKDGRFMYEDDGKTKQISKHNEKDYSLVNPANDVIYDEIAEYEKQISELSEKVRKLRDKLVIKTIADIRAERFPETMEKKGRYF